MNLGQKPEGDYKVFVWWEAEYIQQRRHYFM